MTHICKVEMNSDESAKCLPLNSGFYTCGDCNKSFTTICTLHDHIIDHDMGGSYHYDQTTKTAIPKFDAACAQTQTCWNDRREAKRIFRNFLWRKYYYKPKTRGRNRKGQMKNNMVKGDTQSDDVELDVTKVGKSKYIPTASDIHVLKKKVNDNCFVKLETLCLDKMVGKFPDDKRINKITGNNLVKVDQAVVKEQGKIAEQVEKVDNAIDLGAANKTKQTADKSKTDILSDKEDGDFMDFVDDSDGNYDDDHDGTTLLDSVEKHKSKYNTASASNLFTTGSASHVGLKNTQGEHVQNMEDSSKEDDNMEATIQHKMHRRGRSKKTPPQTQNKTVVKRKRGRPKQIHGFSDEDMDKEGEKLWNVEKNIQEDDKESTVQPLIGQRGRLKRTPPKIQNLTNNKTKKNQTQNETEDKTKLDSRKESHEPSFGSVVKVKGEGFGKVGVIDVGYEDNDLDGKLLLVVNSECIDRTESKDDIVSTSNAQVALKHTEGESVHNMEETSKGGNSMESTFQPKKVPRGKHKKHSTQIQNETGAKRKRGRPKQIHVSSDESNDGFGVSFWFLGESVDKAKEGEKAIIEDVPPGKMNTRVRTETKSYCISSDEESGEDEKYCESKKSEVEDDPTFKLKMHKKRKFKPPPVPGRGRGRPRKDTKPLDDSMDESGIKSESDELTASTEDNTSGSQLGIRKMKTYTCKKCGETMPEHLQVSHKAKHSRETINQTMVCHFCGMNVKKCLMDKHVRKNHTGETPFKCDQCGQSFHIKRDLNGHRTRHHTKGRLKCKYCDADFHQPSTLKIHMMLHTGERPFICPHCGFTFRINNHLQKHISCVHLKVKKFKCDICFKKFGILSNLKGHMNKHLGETVSCQYCGKVFSDPSGCRRHEFIHTGYKRHQCHLCDYKSIQKTPFYAHMEKKHDINRAQVLQILHEKKLQADKYLIKDNAKCIP